MIDRLFGIKPNIPDGNILDAVLRVVRDDSTVERRRSFIGRAVCRTEVRNWIYSNMIDLNTAPGTQLFITVTERAPR